MRHERVSCPSLGPFCTTRQKNGRCDNMRPIFRRARRALSCRTPQSPLKPNEKALVLDQLGAGGSTTESSERAQLYHRIEQPVNAKGPARNNLDF